MTALTTLSPERLALRRSRITATDAAAVLGVSPWRSAYDVWAEKTGKLEGSILPSDAMDWGIRLEDAVLKWGADRLGATITRNQWRTGQHPLLGATLDAITDNGEPLDAKTTGIVHAGPHRDWGEDGSDVVPDAYAVQLTVQMIVTGAQMAHLAALIGGTGGRLYHIPRSARLVEIIEERAEKFWRDHVIADIPPVNSPPSEETIRRIRRVPGKVAELSPLVCAEFAAARRARLDAEKTENAAREALMAQLGDAEAGFAPGWDVLFSEVKATRLDQAAVKEQHPEVFRACVRESAYRKLVVRESQR